MKVYLTGPDRAALFEEAERLREPHAAGRPKYEVFNTAEYYAPRETERERFRYRTWWICENADVVVVMPGWRDCAGCRLAVHLAELLGIPCYTLENFLKRVRGSDPNPPQVNLGVVVV